VGRDKWAEKEGSFGGREWEKGNGTVNRYNLT
jgi:hypothetical protein